MLLVWCAFPFMHASRRRRWRCPVTAYASVVSLYTQFCCRNSTTCNCKFRCRYVTLYWTLTGLCFGKRVPRKIKGALRIIYDTHTEHQPTYALNEVQFITSINLLHVSAPGRHPQGVSKQRNITTKPIQVLLPTTTHNTFCCYMFRLRFVAIINEPYYRHEQHIVPPWMVICT